MEYILSITVAVLSILVVFLLGWQVVTIVSANKSFNLKLTKATKKISRDTRKEFKKMLYKEQADILLEVSMALKGVYDRDDFSFAMDSALIALLHNTTNVSICVDHLVNEYEMIEKEITPARYEGIVEILASTEVDNETVEKFTSFFKKLKVNNSW